MLGSEDHSSSHIPILPSQALAMGDPLQVASLNRSAGSLFKQLIAARDDGDTCYAQDALELIHAVEVGCCLA